VTHEFPEFSDAQHTVGGASDRWGVTDWDASDFGDEVFAIRVYNTNNMGDFLYLDWAAAKVYYEWGSWTCN
jgi:hypothetical protein